MKISEQIKRLSELMNEVGDVETEVRDEFGDFNLVTCVEMVNVSDTDKAKWRVYIDS
jgi:hypothetical protein